MQGYAAANNRTLSESGYHAWSRPWGLLRAASEIQVLGTSNNVLSQLFGGIRYLRLGCFVSCRAQLRQASPGPDHRTCSEPRGMWTRARAEYEHSNPLPSDPVCSYRHL